MLKAVKDAGGLAVAVDNGEGCAPEAMQNAHIFIVGITNALDLLLEPIRCKATLRTRAVVISFLYENTLTLLCERVH